MRLTVRTEQQDVHGFVQVWPFDFLAGRHGHFCAESAESELMRGRPRESWLPDMDLNHDKQIQSLLCYRYTIGQARRVKM